MFIGHNYINGKWLPAADGATFESRSPSRWSQVIGIFPRSTEEDARAAVAAARAAYPAWRSLSRIQRAEYLDAVAQLVKAEAEELARLMAQECGKPINECRADVVEGLHTLQFNAGRAREPYGEVVASEVATKDSYVLRKPKGVIVAITPWNFPFAIPLWLIAPSLLEGNTVVFKPSEDTPLLGQKVVELFDRVGLPPGVLNLVQGYGEEAGWPLVTHPEVEVVLFTGSYAVGSQIRQACARDDHKMAVCEMGGKNALIVLDDADLELAVRAGILSAFKTSGQRCVSASRILVQEGVFDAFAQRFVDTARRLNIGDPLQEDTFMGPLINPDAVRKVSSYNALALEEGAEPLLHGGPLQDGTYADGCYMAPFIYRMEHRSDARVLREEVFGPHVALIPFRTLDDAVRIYNDSDYAFALGIISNDYRKVWHLRRECDFGVGYVNLPTIGAEVHLPFGGLKRSGTGLPSASALIDVVTHKVAWTVNHGREIVMAQGLRADVP